MLSTLRRASVLSTNWSTAPVGRQAADPRVADLVPQCGGEPACLKDLVGPVEESARRGIQRPGQAELVVPGGRRFQGLDQRPLAVRPAGRGHGGRQRRHQPRCVREPGEGGAQPLAVRRVAAAHQQAEPHQVAGEPGGDHGRAELVTGLGAPAGETLFLGDALPLAGQHVPPHVARVPGQGGARRVQLAQAVVEHRPGGHLGQPLGRGGQPVQQGHRAPGVEPEPAGQPGAETHHLDPVPGPAARVGGQLVRRRVAAEGGREALGQHRGDAGGVRAGVAVGQEDLQPRAPVVVGGALGVEAEHLRALPQPRRAVAQAGERLAEQRAHHPGVVLPRQLETGQERHAQRRPRDSGTGCGCPGMPVSLPTTAGTRQRISCRCPPRTTRRREGSLFLR